MRLRGELQGDGGLRTELQALLRRPLFLALLALAFVEAVRLVVDPTPLDLVGVILIAIVAFVSGREREEASGLEGSRSEAESFARILRGLARSVSPDAIVDAIVEELGHGDRGRSRGRGPPPARDAEPRGDPLAHARGCPAVAHHAAAARARRPAR